MASGQDRLTRLSACHVELVEYRVVTNTLHLHNTFTMFQDMQDDVPIEIVKIQVAPVFRGFEQQFPN